MGQYVEEEEEGGGGGCRRVAHRSLLDWLHV